MSRATYEFHPKAFDFGTRLIRARRGMRIRADVGCPDARNDRSDDLSGEAIRSRALKSGSGTPDKPSRTAGVVTFSCTRSRPASTGGKAERLRILIALYRRRNQISLLKDPYNFDFLSLGPAILERDLERGLITHLRNLLLELGKGFAFVGSQFRLQVGGEDYNLDLLFYHLRLRCYIVFAALVDEDALHMVK